MIVFKIITIFLVFVSQTDAKPTITRNLSKDQIAKIRANLDTMTQLLTIKYKLEAAKRAARKTKYRKRKLVCHIFFHKMFNCCKICKSCNS